jgi:hypothetical protein
METKKTIPLVLGAVVLATILMARPAPAAEYCCPYGDSLCFATLVELQNHVITMHPGERIPIIINW